MPRVPPVTKATRPLSLSPTRVATLSSCVRSTTLMLPSSDGRGPPLAGGWAKSDIAPAPWARPGPAARLPLRPHCLHDVCEDLLAEVRCELHRGQVRFHLVEVLQPQHIVADEIGDDAGEEEAEGLDALREMRGAGMRQRQVDADPVDAAQEELAQANPHDVREIGAVSHHAQRSLAPLRKNLHGDLRGAGRRGRRGRLDRASEAPPLVYALDHRLVSRGQIH